MTMPIRPLLAIGLATAGISVTLASPAAAAPSTSSHPGPSAATSQHLVRNSAKATPTGGITASHKSATSSSRTGGSSSAQGSTPTSKAFRSPSDSATQGAVKHHWGTHHGHGLL
jgi:hypothetical protein